jgi:hypothetical protein
MIDKMRSWLAYLFRKKKLKELFQLTADAFLAEMPELHRLTYDAGLLSMRNLKKPGTALSAGNLSGKRSLKSVCTITPIVSGGYWKRACYPDMGRIIERACVIYQLIGIWFRYVAAKPKRSEERERIMQF